MNTERSSSVKSAKSAGISGHHGEAVVGEAVSPERFAEALREQGYDFFTGVPCSLVSGLIAELERRPDTSYYPETREDAAVGLACGAMMAGKQPVVVMQNSGLGVCINALTSLTLMYCTPCLLLITWRGYEGKDAPEHIIMGEVCGKLLETIGIPWRAPDPETLLDDLAWATAYQREQGLPASLLLRPGVTR
jgi:sulfopyruvate decarboxylase subunit alpha